MPHSSQALYFHLGLHADDDGVVEAYTVVKTVGAVEDDLRILCAKGFVQVLNEDLVAYITDWRENNKLRADRKIDSIYKDLLLKVVPDVDPLQAKNRADRPPRLLVGTTVTPPGQQWDVPGTAQDRLGEDRLGKERLEDSEPDKPAPRPRFVKPTLEEIKAYCQERKNKVDPERFLAYYESNGWKVGRNPMKDWKAAVRNWERNSYAPSQRQQNTGAHWDDLDGIL